MSAFDGTPRTVPGQGLPLHARGAARALALLYFLSGATGLAYEVLWARMLSAEFGLSIFGVAATVAAFLLGLGLGAAAATALVVRPRARGNGIRAALNGYAALELAVAVYAAALPALEAFGGPLIDAAAAQLDRGAWYAVQGVLALVLLGIPAAAVGASFPLILRAQRGTGMRVGALYAANSLGAASGALLSLALLAAAGWAGAVRTIALVGTAVAGAAFVLARALPAEEAVAARSPGGPATSGAAVAWRVAPAQLLAYAGVGACAMVLEIGWTRLYGLVMLRTEYVLAIILAVYLLGTALGSALAARPRPWMDTVVPLAAAFGTLLGLWTLAPFCTWLQARQFGSLASALAFDALALALCTLPVTMALGAWLPLLAARLGAPTDAAFPAMRLYAANCLGGAAGAVVAVVLAIPLLGTAGTLALTAVLILLLALGLGAPRPVLAALPLAALLAVLLHALPTPARLLGPVLAGSVVRFSYEDALSLNHVIEAPDGQRTLLTDLQHMDASSEPAAVALQADQARLPLLLHPHPHSVLFLGLGTGITASGSLPWPELRRTAVEISPGAVVAARDWFAPVNGGVVARLAMRQDDARHFLAADRARYDVIIGDLFHPDLAGTGNLLSVEQFARARARLADGGVFAQWLALNQFDRESLHTVLRSFQWVFPGGRIFLDGAHLAMVGSRGAAAAPAQALRANLAALGPAQAEAATGAEGAATWLGRYWGPIAAGVGELQSETRPVIEFRLPRLRYAQSMDEPGGAALQTAPPVAEILLELLRQRPDAARAQTQLGVPPEERDAFSSAYAASELAVQAWIAAMAGDEHQARQLVRLAYEANPRDRWIAGSLADDLFASARDDGSLEASGTLERILRIDPDHPGALRAVLQRERAQRQREHRGDDPDSPVATQARERLQRLVPLDHDAGAIGVRSR